MDSNQGVALAFSAIPILVAVGALVILALNWFPQEYRMWGVAVPVLVGFIAGGYFLMRAGRTRGRH